MIKILKNCIVSGFKHNQLKQLQWKSPYYNINALTRLHSSPFIQFSSSTKLTKDDLNNILKLNKENNYDSAFLLNQFEEKVKMIDDIQLASSFCKNYLITFQSRMEIEKALSVCQVAIKLSKKLSSQASITTYIFFKAKQIMLIYEQGNVDEVKKLSAELFAYFTVSKEQLDPNDKIKSIIFLAQQMNSVGLFDYSEKYLQGSLNQLQTIPNLQLNKLELYNLYYISFGLSFQKQEYQDAINTGLVAYELIKTDLSTQRPQNLLVGLYICFKNLNQTEFCQKMIQLLQQHPPIPNFNLEDIDKVKYEPFRRIFNPKKASQLQPENQGKQTVTTNQSDQEFFMEIDKSGKQFLENRTFKEGIEFFSKLSQTLDPEKEIIKILLLQDFQAYLHSCMLDLNKALSLSLDTHQRLLKLRDNILFNDAITFQNIYFIKMFYYQKHDYQKSIEWGRKMHAYCLKYNLFELNDDKLSHSLQAQIASLNLTKQIQEALEYSNFVEGYLQKFNNQKWLFENNLIKASINIELDNMEELLKYTKLAIDYYKQHRGSINEETERLYYQALLVSSLYLTEIQDIDSLILIGQEFLKIRDKFESDEESNKLRIIILFHLSRSLIKEQKFEEAEQATKDCLQLAKTDPESRSVYIKLIYQYIALALKISKVKEAEEYIKIAEQFKEKEMEDQTLRDDASVQLLKFQSIVCSLRKDFDKSLDFFSKQLVLSQEQDKSISKQQREILKKLLENSQYSTQVKNLIVKYNIDLNK